MQRIWYSLALYNNSDYKAVLNTTVHVQHAMELDPKMGLFVNVLPSGMLVGNFYTEWTSQPNGFAAYDALAPAAIAVPPTNATLFGLISTLAGQIPLEFARYVDRWRWLLTLMMNPRRDAHINTHGINLDLYIAIHERYLQKLESSRNFSARLSYTIQPMDVAGVQAGLDRGGNIMGIPLVPQTCKTSRTNSRQSLSMPRQGSFRPFHGKIPNSML
jgi:hypothetical protein